MEMPSRLLEIVQQKRIEAEALKSRAAELRKAALTRNNFRGFRRHLYLPSEMTLIAEVKKASPSEGDIAVGIDPAEQAALYEQCGANALSILTDKKFFKGSLDDLRAAREMTRIPVLRKDFIVSPLQVHESVAAGADAILLIVAALNDNELHDLYHLARDLQLDVLVETHDLREMDRALELGADIIGINNRNLHTFEINLETTAELAQEIPSDCIAVAESGIQTREDVVFCQQQGINTLLIGTTLMRSPDVKGTIQQLLGK